LKKRVAIIIPGGIGGGYFMQGIPVLEDYIKRISESFDVTVYSMIKTDRAYQPQYFTLRHTNAAHTHHIFWKIILLTLLVTKDHLRNKYELVHGIWGFPAGFLAVVFGKIFRIPSIVSLQGGEAACIPKIPYGNMYSISIRKFTLWTCKHADVLTALTNFQITELQKFGFMRKNAHIIPYGADEKLFVMNEKKLIAPFRFIHVANLTEVKDQVTLLKAFKLISEKAVSSLRIVGDGSCLSQLKTLAKNLGVEEKIEFIGAIPHKNLPEHLHWAQVMLHTSLYEGQAVVIAEAAACGVVICGTRVGLIADWGEERCIPVDCLDFQTMAHKVLELLGNYEKYAILQNKAYEWALRHTAATMAASFQELYSQLLS
jgi:glycosyltransferase involved in cell wall biosynthesis